MKIAVLTGGGDCPGLNAAIRAIAKSAWAEGDEVHGILEGWAGLAKRKSILLSHKKISGLLTLGGTILGTARINPLKSEKSIQAAEKYFREQKFDALLSIGGEGTLQIAAEFYRRGMPVICIPKTIDNDTWGTDYSIGFDTAVQIATEAIDRLHTTAESHQRVMIVEVMGRHAGWIALYSGIAGGADAILIPEKVFPIIRLCDIVKARAKRGRKFSIFVVSEDAKIELEGKKILETPSTRDEYGDIKLGGIGEALATELRRRSNSEVRVTVLGHVQRGGTPTAFDRILATRLGVKAVELARKKDFGKLVVLSGNEIQTLPIQKSAGKVKQVDAELQKVAEVFFG
ncbi:MAG: 6-phosphofructokinase [Deltaproteobacteria bacterium]|nr:6-phosphofructokinase [Deltaproteobacteria bacterium]